MIKTNLYFIWNMVGECKSVSFLHSSPLMRLASASGDVIASTWHALGSRGRMYSLSFVSILEPLRTVLVTETGHRWCLPVKVILIDTPYPTRNNSLVIMKLTLDLMIHSLRGGPLMTVCSKTPRIATPYLARQARFGFLLWDHILIATLWSSLPYRVLYRFLVVIFVRSLL